MSADERSTAMSKYVLALKQTRQQEARVATLRENLKQEKKLFLKSEDDLKALQVGGGSLPLLFLWGYLFSGAGHEHIWTNPFPHKFHHRQHPIKPLHPPCRVLGRLLGRY